MPNTRWLPSERAWLDQLSTTVFDGEIVLVRSIPRWGLTTVCAEVAETLGDSAVLVSGRSITESNQKSIRRKIDADVASAIAKTGYAQLIFDDYSRAISRSQGGTLHSMLYRLLVDCETARDTGALLIARSGDTIDLNFSGSPLVSRAQMYTLPTLASDDAEVIGIDLVALQKMTGESTWLARRFIDTTLRQGKANAVEHLRNDRRRIVSSLPPTAVEVLAGARHPVDIDTVGREALLCLGKFDDSSNFEPASLVRESSLLVEVRQRSPGWPRSEEESANRFAELLAGAEDAIWVDRYLFREPNRVRNFLLRLRHITETRLRLLVSDDRGRPGLAHEITSAMSDLEGVGVRFMHGHDRRRLHDRHLVLPALDSGFVLPTAGVILGADDPGSAVSVPMPALAINYVDCWRRGRRAHPASNRNDSKRI